ncbi:GYF domain-containing protein [Akkermansiaceae bacterium]|nr:GYF domain-containing protein [Akkermansiaceae bacterium]
MSKYQQWYYIDKEFNEVGPVFSSQLLELVQAGEIVKSSYVWTEELEEWVPSSTISGLYPEVILEVVKPLRNPEFNKETGSYSLDLVKKETIKVAERDLVGQTTKQFSASVLKPISATTKTNIVPVAPPEANFQPSALSTGKILEQSSESGVFISPSPSSDTPLAPTPLSADTAKPLPAAELVTQTSQTPSSITASGQLTTPALSKLQPTSLNTAKPAVIPTPNLTKLSTPHTPIIPLTSSQHEALASPSTKSQPLSISNIPPKPAPMNNAIPPASSDQGFTQPNVMRNHVPTVPVIPALGASISSPVSLQGQNLQELPTATSKQVPLSSMANRFGNLASPPVIPPINTTKEQQRLGPDANQVKIARAPKPMQRD